MPSTFEDRALAQYLPKDVLALEFNPERKLAHFVVELRNVPGALERSAAVLTRAGVNILSGFHEAPSKSDRALWSFFADLTDARVEPAQIVQELKSQPTTIDARYESALHGLLIDGFHFPLRYGGKRAIMMQAYGMGTVLSRVSEIFGGGPAARVLLYEMGEAVGSFIYKELVSLLGANVFRNQMDQIIGLYRSLGWGIITLDKIDHEMKTAVIRARENFECIHQLERSGTSRNHFLRGHLAGWLSELFGKKVEVTETHCITSGDRYCEFVAKPISA